MRSVWLLPKEEVIRCPKATTLRHEMRSVWLLPKKEDFLYTGPDWLLLLLDQVDDEAAAYILLIFWRAWHLRNNVVHGDGLSSVTGSAKFLLHMWDSLVVASDREVGSDKEKGKRPVHDGRPKKDSRKESNERHKWEPPPMGWVKLNVDAAYCQETGEAGMGLIVQDEDGKAMLVAWKGIKGCGSPEQGEAVACLEGLRLTTKWVKQSTLVESDCLNLIREVQKTTGSTYAGILVEIKGAMGLLPDCKVSHIQREANEIAHTLAQRANRQQEYVVMRLNNPEFIRHFF
jgi:hypothetical protein